MEITAGVGAFSQAAIPTVTINGVNEPLGPDGAAHKTTYQLIRSLGKHTVQVVVEYTDLDGQKKTLRKRSSIWWVNPQHLSPLDKMNVLYIGVDKPGDRFLQAAPVMIRSDFRSLAWWWYLQKEEVMVSTRLRVTSVTDDCWINDQRRW